MLRQNCKVGDYKLVQYNYSDSVFKVKITTFDDRSFSGNYTYSDKYKTDEPIGHGMWLWSEIRTFEDIMSENKNEVVTLNNVIAAYAKTGLKPVKGGMLKENNCACALGALYCAENGLERSEDVDSVEHIWKWARVKFGIDYVAQFWKGFDGAYLAEADEVYYTAKEISTKVFELYNKGELYG